MPAPSQKESAMSRIRTPDNIEIASLKGKKAEFFDVMAPGPGTPWEDRGTHGVVGAFIKTCVMSLFNFFRLVDSIRRPETTGEARGFLIGCCVLWGACAFLHGLIFMYFAGRVRYHVVDTQTYLIYCAVAAIGAGGGLFLLFRLYNLIYGKLIAQEKTASKIPDVLLFNVNAYALGPSLLAPIPFAGPVLAGLLIFINLIIAGRKRLNLRMAAALIDAIISFVIVTVIAFAGYWIVGGLLLPQLLDHPVTDTTPKVISPP